MEKGFWSYFHLSELGSKQKGGPFTLERRQTTGTTISSMYSCFSKEPRIN